MEKVLHPAETRGAADFGWLKARYSFSFANYFNPKRMKFGKLRVLNDDQIAPGKGFGKHPHKAMEIITIPLKGSLEHTDSLGNKGIVKAGEVQVMSAGTGIEHNETNASQTEDLNLLQLWVFTDSPGIAPRYDQQKFKEKEMHNKFLTIVAPKKAKLLKTSLKVHQETYFNLGHFDANKEKTYNLRERDHGVYIFLIKGKIEVASEELTKRDAIGVWNVSSITIKPIEESSVLLIEVPMN